MLFPADFVPEAERGLVKRVPVRVDHVQGLGQLTLLVRALEDEAVLARLHELARTTLQGRHHGRSARERFQDSERTSVEVSRKHKSIRPREDLSTIVYRAQKMHAATQTKTLGQATEGTWIVTAADKNVPLFHARKSLQDVA